MRCSEVLPYGHQSRVQSLRRVRRVAELRSLGHYALFSIMSFVRRVPDATGLFHMADSDSAEMSQVLDSTQEQFQVGHYLEFDYGQPIRSLLFVGFSSRQCELVRRICG